MNETVPALIGSLITKFPKRTAVVEGERSVSYLELGELISARGQWLIDRGLRQGDRVGLLLPNSLDFVVSYFAILTFGGVVVPLNEHYQEREISRFLTSSGSKALVTKADYAGLAAEVAQNLPSSLDIVVVEDRPRALSGNQIGVDIDPDSPAMNQFSSGTTGAPKRIARTHRNLLCEMESFHLTLGTSHQDRFLGAAPFSHVNGLMRSMMACLTCGGTLYPVARFDRRAVAKILEQKRISVFISVPFMFSTLARTSFRPSPDFTALRLCVSASAAMPADLNRLFNAQFGIWVRQLYGSTETGTISVNLDVDASRALDSVGKPVAGVEVGVFAEDGQLASGEEIGEFGVRSPAAIAGYEGLPEVNAEVFREGYFLTGDLGRKDNLGRLFLEGRKKFFINKGGYKINPAEIEAILESHPAVEEAVVAGVPTRLGDERIQAFVVVSRVCDELTLVDFCRGKIADFKIPAW